MDDPMKGSSGVLFSERCFNTHIEHFISFLIKAKVIKIRL